VDLFSVQLTVAWVPTVERIRYHGYICSTPTLRSNGTVFPLYKSGNNVPLYIYTVDSLLSGMDSKEIFRIISNRNMYLTCELEFIKRSIHLRILVH
jgi:hypothetical protein